MPSFPWLDGWRGHDDEALARLVDFVQDLNEREPAELIATGDITAWGKDSEFDVADAFLRAELPSPPFPSMLGLSASDWKERAIPGNHDHWPGYPYVLMMGNPTPSLRIHFPWLPWFFGPLIPLSSGHNLRFVGLNTDADVHPYSLDRFFALGAFHNAASQLRQQLPPVEPNEIRVLLLHHSPAHNGFTRRIRSLSRSNLFDLLQKHKIHVVLTGHIHDSHLLDSATVSTIHPGTLILEARCGTTTQVRSAKLRIPGLRASNHVNRLLVHRLELAGGQIVWSSKLYILGVTGKFDYPGDPYMGLRTQASTIVWPHQW